MNKNKFKPFVKKWVIEDVPDEIHHEVLYSDEELPIQEAVKQEVDVKELKKPEEQNQEFIEWLHNQENNVPEKIQSESSSSSSSSEKNIEWLDSEDGIKPDDLSSSEEELKEDKEARTLFVTNLPKRVTDQQLMAYFGKYGTIVNLDVPRNEGSIFNKGRAFIEFSLQSEAEALISETLFIEEHPIGLQLLGNNKRQRSRSRSKQ